MPQLLLLAAQLLVLSGKKSQFFMMIILEEILMFLVLVTLHSCPLGMTTLCVTSQFSILPNNWRSQLMCCDAFISIIQEVNILSSLQLKA